MARRSGAQQCPDEPLGPDPTQILLVQTDSSGDFSTYRLMIVDSASDPELAPRAEFDPLLAAVDFSFKVDCPSDFDCAKTPACPPAAPLPPVDIDYLSKDYQSFYQLLINRLATTMPQWQERNGADVGVTLVELFSYVGDQLSYYQDAVATEAYLGTARQRISVRRHARLLDYLMHDGVDARAFVCLLPTPVADGATVPAGTAISERDAQLGPGDHPLEQAAALGAAGSRRCTTSSYMSPRTRSSSIPGAIRPAACLSARRPRRWSAPPPSSVCSAATR